jgi:hypothetical protein
MKFDPILFILESWQLKKKRNKIIFWVKNFHFTCESHEDAKKFQKIIATQVSNKSPLNKDLVIRIIN